MNYSPLLWKFYEVIKCGKSVVANFNTCLCDTKLYLEKTLGVSQIEHSRYLHIK